MRSAALLSGSSFLVIHTIKPCEIAKIAPESRASVRAEFFNLQFESSNAQRGLPRESAAVDSMFQVLGHGVISQASTTAEAAIA